jgi:hypothetical protein
MFVLLLSSLALQGPLFRGLISHPTGANGYEEYVAAADLVSSPMFDQFMIRLKQYRPDQEDADITLPPTVNAKDTDLTVRRKFIDQFQRSLDLVEQGNQKPVYDPRDRFGPDTTLPELRYFKTLTRLEGIAANVDFADGKTEEGVKRIESTLTFSSKISGGPLIFRLVGIACASIATRELDHYWPQLSVEDADELVRYFDDTLSEPDQLIQSLRSEEKAGIAALGAFLDDPAKFAAGGEFAIEGEKPDGFDDIAKLNPGDRMSLKQDAGAEIYRQFESVIQRLSGPESGWVVPAPDEDSSTASLAKKVADTVIPATSQSVVAELKIRTRFRLCRLTAKAISYKWTNGHLPTSITDFTTPEERIDPSGGQFVYRKEKDGSWFKILRIGNDALGEINAAATPASPPAGSTAVPTPRF